MWATPQIHQAIHPFSSIRPKSITQRETLRPEEQYLLPHPSRRTLRDSGDPDAHERPHR